MGIGTALTIATTALGIGASTTGIAGQVNVSSANGQPSVQATAQQPAAGTNCDDGRWLGPDGINVQGRPDSFDAGDVGAAYVWHDDYGWHLRTTDRSAQPHSYTGSIALSAGARVTDVTPVRNERDDHVWVTGDNVLHYSLVTHRGIDGFNFRVSACAGDRDRETMRFSMDYNGREQDAARIRLGDTKQNPPAATFTVRRSV